MSAETKRLVTDAEAARWRTTLVRRYANAERIEALLDTREALIEAGDAALEWYVEASALPSEPHEALADLLRQLRGEPA